MAVGETPADFERWVEPHLTVLTRYAGRRAAPADRDDMVCRSLIRAYQRWSTYDVSRSYPGRLAARERGCESRRDHDDRDGGGMVELVDRADTGPLTRDVALERAVDGLRGRGRAAVDLHYFVGVDVAIVADVLRCSPDTVEAPLRQAQDRLGRLVGDSMDDPMHQRLTAAARRWQDEQPPARDPGPAARRARSCEVPAASHADRCRGAGARRWRRGHRQHPPPGRHHGCRPRPIASPTPHVQRAQKVVPFRDLDPSHLTLGHVQDGVLLTPYDDVTATGNIAGDGASRGHPHLRRGAGGAGAGQLPALPRLHDHLRHGRHDAAAELRRRAVLRQPGPVDREGDQRSAR